MFSVEHASSIGPAAMEDGRSNITGFLFSS